MQLKQQWHVKYRLGRGSKTGGVNNLPWLFLNVGFASFLGKTLEYSDVSGRSTPRTEKATRRKVAMDVPVRAGFNWNTTAVVIFTEATDALPALRQSAGRLCHFARGRFLVAVPESSFIESRNSRSTRGTKVFMYLVPEGKDMHQTGARRRN